MNKLIIIGILIFAALTRLIPHPPNFTPIIAMGLFGGAYLKDFRLALIIPIAAMLIADLFLGFHGTMLWVYGSLMLITGIGTILKNRTTFANYMAVTLGSALLFFLVTNFGVWIGSGFYPKSVAGLVTCYSLAIPFFGNTVAGSLFYGAVMFGGFAQLKSNLPEAEIESIQD